MRASSESTARPRATNDGSETVEYKVIRTATTATEVTTAGHFRHRATPTTVLNEMRRRRGSGNAAGARSRNVVLMTSSNTRTIDWRGDSLSIVRRVWLTPRTSRTESLCG